MLTGIVCFGDSWVTGSVLAFCNKWTLKFNINPRYNYNRFGINGLIESDDAKVTYDVDLLHEGLVHLFEVVVHLIEYLPGPGCQWKIIKLNILFNRIATLFPLS